MEVDVVVTGARQTQALIDRLSHRLDDQTPALYALVDSLLEVHRERFEGRGVRWRKLDPETRRIDRQQGRDPRANVNTGLLMRSLTQRGARGQVVRVTPTSLHFGTRVWYAQFAKKLGRNPVGASRAQKKHLVNELRDLLLRDL